MRLYVCIYIDIILISIHTMFALHNIYNNKENTYSSGDPVIGIRKASLVDEHGRGVSFCSALSLQKIK